jgi:hypothetical protein
VWRFVLLHEVLHPARSTELSDVPVANISSLSYSGHAIQVFAPFFQNQHLPLRISPRPHYPTQFLYLPAKHPQGELTDSEHQAWSLKKCFSIRARSLPTKQKTEEGTPPAFEKGMVLLSQTSWQALFAPQHPFFCHRARN